MRFVLDELRVQLGDIRALLLSISPTNAALAPHSDTLVRQYLAIRRRFDYSAFVVALYSAFEGFVESLVSGYAQQLSSFKRYDQLPNALTLKHLAKTGELLNRGRIGTGRHSDITERELITNLFNCVTGSADYRLNSKAVSAHELNLRRDELSGLFKTIGIDGAVEKIRLSEPLCKWFCEEKGVNPGQDGVPSTTIDSWIDDLVERRNCVSHRGVSPDSIQGPHEMLAVCSFVEAVCTALYDLAVGSYLRLKYIDSDVAIRLRRTEGPYQNGSVVVVDVPGHLAVRGRPVIGLAGSGLVRWGRMVELQVDGKVVTDVSASSSKEVNVGVRVDFRCAKGMELYVLEQEDEAVWAPSEDSATTEDSQSDGSGDCN